MKKMLFVMLAVVAVVAASCSKEAKLNKTLDGTWNVTKIDGAALPTGMSMKITFVKGKKGVGTYTSVTTIPGFGTDTQTGSYELEDDTKLYMTPTGGTKDTTTVVSYSKTDIKFSSVSGTTTTTIEAVKE